MNAEDLAKKIHDTREMLAPAFDHKSAPPWDALPENSRNLLIAVARVLLNDLHRLSDQGVAADRNMWQYRLGALMTLVEAFCDNATKHGLDEAKVADLQERAYMVVNTNPFSKNLDDPYADIAQLAIRDALTHAIAGGLVVPGPNAPKWTLDVLPSLRGEGER